MAWGVLAGCLLAVVFVQAAMIQALRTERDTLKRQVAWKRRVGVR